MSHSSSSVSLIIIMYVTGRILDMISDFCKVQVKNEPCQTGKGVFLSMRKRLDLQTRIEND